MNQDKNNPNLKTFFIKLIAITFSIIIIINVAYNLIFADKFNNLSKFFDISSKENIEQIKDKIRLEINKGLAKEKILNDDDKILLYKLYLKVKNEFNELDKN